ncbi:pyridoxamine 5'-phosphate oxidase, partial [Enterococcus hirae]
PGRDDPARSLADLEARCWYLLEADAGDAGRGLATPVLATVGTDGSAAARTVVLRSATKVSRLLTFHTDRRSAKLREIAAEPR